MDIALLIILSITFIVIVIFLFIYLKTEKENRVYNEQNTEVIQKKIQEILIMQGDKFDKFDKEIKIFLEQISSKVNSGVESIKNENIENRKEIKIAIEQISSKVNSGIESIQN